MCCHGPLQGDLPDPGIEPMPLTFSALPGGFSTTSAPWETGGLWLKFWVVGQGSLVFPGIRDCHQF